MPRGAVVSTPSEAMLTAIRLASIPKCRGCGRVLQDAEIKPGLCATCEPLIQAYRALGAGDICNADLGHPCDADDGEPCPRCAESDRYWQREWERTPESVRRLEMMTQEELNQELRDAGRGHLVRE
jgi:hypothetical protein